MVLKRLSGAADAFQIVTGQQFAVCHGFLMFGQRNVAEDGGGAFVVLDLLAVPGDLVGLDEIVHEAGIILEAQTLLVLFTIKL